MKVSVEERERLLGPENVDVEFGRILEEAGDGRGARLSKLSARMT